MIQFADKYTRLSVRKIWKDVFADEEAYMDLFFTEKYKDENTLLAIEKGQVVAALQMLPFEIKFYGVKLPFYYLAGLSTIPEFRGQGLMSQLIKKSHDVMRQRQIPLSILIPASESLFHYYEQFGYAKTFEKRELDPTWILLRAIWQNSENEKDAYRLFNLTFNDHDFCVQKNFADFMTIIREEIREDFPIKSNLWGMSRIIDPLRLLNLYAKANPQNCFSLSLNDCEFGTTAFSICSGQTTLSSRDVVSDFLVDEKQLAELLFGFHSSKCEKTLQTLFPMQNPIMNYMLE